MIALILIGIAVCFGLLVLYGVYHDLRRFRKVEVQARESWLNAVPPRYQTPATKRRNGA